jgi:hypothetical protein
MQLVAAALQSLWHKSSGHSSLHLRCFALHSFTQLVTEARADDLPGLSDEHAPASMSTMKRPARSIMAYALSSAVPRGPVIPTGARAEKSEELSCIRDSNEPGNPRVRPKRGGVVVRAVGVANEVRSLWLRRRCPMSHAMYPLESSSTTSFAADESGRRRTRLEVVRIRKLL